MDAESEAIARDAVDSAYMIYRELGPGLLETVYEVVRLNFSVNLVKNVL
jgi:hypothetical protein